MRLVGYLTSPLRPLISVIDGHWTSLVHSSWWRPLISVIDGNWSTWGVNGETNNTPNACTAEQGSSGWMNTGKQLDEYCNNSFRRCYLSCHVDQAGDMSLWKLQVTALPCGNLNFSHGNIWNCIIIIVPIVNVVELHNDPLKTTLLMIFKL